VRSESGERRWRWAAIVVIVVATVAAYANTFGVPFLFDDATNVVANPTIKHLGSLGEVLRPPVAAGVGGRPLLNLSFAISYWFGNGSVVAFHTGNLLIHIGAAMLLLGFVLRTLNSPLLKDRYAAAALSIAFLSALIWALHPVQTGSVTYISQRAESLMGFFTWERCTVLFAGGRKAAWYGTPWLLLHAGRVSQPRRWR
jgi:hypothetical protein